MTDLSISWLVIEIFGNPCRIQVHDYDQKLCSQINYKKSVTHYAETEYRDQDIM